MKRLQSVLMISTIVVLVAFISGCGTSGEYVLNKIVNTEIGGAFMGESEAVYADGQIESLNVNHPGFEYKVNFKYDTEGKCTLTVHEGAGENVPIDYRVAYDETGSTLTTVQEDKYGTKREYRYDSQGRIIYVYEDGNLTTTYDYNSDGKMIREYHYSYYGDRWSEYYYDAAGNLTDVLTYNENGILSSRIYEYDEEDKLVKVSLQEKSGEPYDYVTFTYNEKGQLAEKINHSGELSYKCEYDKHGNLIKKTFGYWLGDEEFDMTHTTEFEYIKTSNKLQDKEKQCLNCGKHHSKYLTTCPHCWTSASDYFYSLPPMPPGYN